MADDGISKVVLKEISEKMVVKKEEIVKFLESRVENPKEMAESIVGEFISRGFVRVTPVGDSTFAITQKGMKEVK